MQGTEPRDIEQKVDQLLLVSRQMQAAVLDLQKSLTAPEGALFVRSCTSCLQDSCNKPSSITTAQPTSNPSPQG